ncbi:WD repeat-containing protein 3-like [Dysidea avara]|uniref:WD repeat-containing protein 3-like n=1 Tax=Dysidea avara TaxID=196820 RepID=UPI00332CD014
MPLTKQYLRYRSAGSFGVVCSKKSNVLVSERRASNKKYELRAIAPSLENVVVWDLRKEEKVCILEGDKHEVTSLASGDDVIAVGYTNGVVKLWNLSTAACTTTLSGHRSSVTCLVFDHVMVRLISGAKDNDVIIWDVVNECGLCKMSGHKAPITDCVVMTTSNVLITSSKDTTIKLWDLDTYHCFQTLVECHSEVWSLALVAKESKLVVGSSDRELRVWELELTGAEQEVDVAQEKATIGQKRGPPSGDDMMANDVTENSERNVPVRCNLIGSIKRGRMDKVSHIRIDPSGVLLLCQNGDKTVDVYEVRSEADLNKVLRKRRKKLRKQQQQQQQQQQDNDDITSDDVTLSVTDQLSLLATIKMDVKIKSFDITSGRGSIHKLLIALSDNSITSYNLNISNKPITCEQHMSLTSPGHRSDVRTVCYSSDDSCIASGSADSVKIWSGSTHRCVSTIQSGYCLCSAFVPGDRHLLIGTKSGEIQLFNLATSSLLESVQAHDEGKAVWSLCLQPDKRGFVSGSADHTVKFWEFELVSDDENPTSKKLTMSHTRTLKMTEDVLCVKYSPNQKLLVVSLLDSTVKVFFADTLKFFLSLYGHKLPVLCLDISSDNTVLVTGSADKNIKLWGLDFGDCHKSIFAHDDSVMAVQFIPGTHLVFSAGKDHMVKCWDGDKFEQVMTLPGHQAEVWCMTVSHNGDHVVTGSHDSSIRVWERTQEPLVLSEEQENEREEEFEESIMRTNEPRVIPGEVKSEASLAGRKTIETVKCAEQIMEAIELYKEESLKLLDYEEECKAAGKKLPAPQRNPILDALGMSSVEWYVLQVLKKVKSSELEESLLVMPFSYMPHILTLLNHWIKSGWEVELSCRCLFFLLRVHHAQLVSSQELLPLMEELRQHTTEQVTKLKDMVGFNMAGLQFLRRQLDAQGQPVFADVTEKSTQTEKETQSCHTQIVFAHCQ